MASVNYGIQVWDKEKSSGQMMWKWLRGENGDRLQYISRFRAEAEIRLYSSVLSTEVRVQEILV